MSIYYLDNNAVYSLVNEAYKQAVGEKAVATQSLADFIDGGIAHDDLGKYREQFTKALILNGVKTVYMDALYKRAKSYGFRVEDMQFKAILQAVTITAPEVQAAHNWQTFTDGDSIGTYSIKIPSVDATLYGKTSSWELQYDITGNQWDDAFTSETEIESFVGAIRLAIANAIEAHDEELDDVLRNALIAECFKNDAKVTAHSISAIDLRKAYNAEMKPSVAEQYHCISRVRFCQSNAFSAVFDVYLSYQYPGGANGYQKPEVFCRRRPLRVHQQGCQRDVYLPAAAQPYHPVHRGGSRICPDPAHQPGVAAHTERRKLSAALQGDPQ